MYACIYGNVSTQQRGGGVNCSGQRFAEMLPEHRLSGHSWKKSKVPLKAFQHRKAVYQIISFYMFVRNELDKVEPLSLMVLVSLFEICHV